MRLFFIKIALCFSFLLFGSFEYGDKVLVPSKDKANNKDIIRQAAVAHGNHLVDPKTLKPPLKKIIKVVKRKAEDILSVR